jgi:osmotically-inducible protein OsmY
VVLPSPDRLGALIAVFALFWNNPTIAEEASQPANVLDPVVVKAARVYTDDEVTKQVETALRLDPVVDDKHVTVTTHNGVVTLHGFVQDAWDLLALRRISRKIAGVKKIINDVDLQISDQ